MTKIAAIFGHIAVYWSPVIVAMATAAAVLLFLSLYSARGGRAAAAAVFIPLAIALSTVLSRLIHWYCRFESYASLTAALTDYTGGGYSMLGVFIGCFLAAAVVRLLGLCDSLPELLDCATPAGAGGMALGRLSCLFNALDRGMLLDNATSLPFASAVTNPVSGVTEYRLATFMLQSFVALILCVALLIVFARQQRRQSGKTGDVALIFLLLYSASEIVLDSTRYDSLFMRSNGFISIIQIAAALSMVFVAVLMGIRLLRARGIGSAAILWALSLACLGGVGYMEYFVQRHGDRTLLSYSVMTVCLAVYCAGSIVANVLSGSADVSAPRRVSAPNPPRRRKGRHLA